jgi:hypothetical protein
MKITKSNTASSTYTQLNTLLKKEIMTLKSIPYNENKSISELIDIEYGYIVSSAVRDIISHMNINDDIEGNIFATIYDCLLDGNSFDYMVELLKLRHIEFI